MQEENRYKKNRYRWSDDDDDNTEIILMIDNRTTEMKRTNTVQMRITNSAHNECWSMKSQLNEFNGAQSHRDNAEDDG